MIEYEKDRIQEAERQRVRETESQRDRETERKNLKLYRWKTKMRRIYLRKRVTTKDSF